MAELIIIGALSVWLLYTAQPPAITSPLLKGDLYSESGQYFYNPWELKKGRAVPAAPSNTQFYPGLKYITKNAENDVMRNGDWLKDYTEMRIKQYYRTPSVLEKSNIGNYRSSSSHMGKSVSGRAPYGFSASSQNQVRQYFRTDGEFAPSWIPGFKSKYQM
jgi:hypothetical protein